MISEYLKIQNRILQNLSEFTDDHILSDGSLGAVPGSDADFLYDDEEYEHYAKLIGCVAK